MSGMTFLKGLSRPAVMAIALRRLRLMVNKMTGMLKASGSSYRITVQEEGG